MGAETVMNMCKVIYAFALHIDYMVCVISVAAVMKLAQ